MTTDGFKVDFFCVGVAKAGTTTLHDLLSLQQNITLPRIKETNYFSFGIHGKPAFSGPLDSTSVNEPTVTSLDDYIANFEQKEGALIGEICPSYALNGAAENIYRHNPKAKIIILLREPVSRAFSNYQHLVRDGREHESFEAALAAETDRLEQGWEWFWGLKQNSYYTEFVSKYLSLFGADNVRVFFFEDFVKDQRKHLQDIFCFLELDLNDLVYQELDSNKSGVVSGRWKLLHKLLLSQGFLNSILRTLLPSGLRKKLGHFFKSISTVKGEISDETRFALAREFKPDLEELHDLVGDRVYGWLAK